MNDLLGVTRGEWLYTTIKDKPLIVSMAPNSVPHSAIVPLAELATGEVRADRMHCNGFLMANARRLYIANECLVDASDRLMAALITHTAGEFAPTKSGPVWAALVRAKLARTMAEGFTDVHLGGEGFSEQLNVMDAWAMLNNEGERPVQSIVPAIKSPLLTGGEVRP